jgi:SAM-dependent methyltransferase
LNFSRIFKNYSKLLVDNAGKTAFLKQLPQNPSLLDVGCGNNSLTSCKGVRKDILYHGIDVADYNITEHEKAQMDQYIISSPEGFSDSIRSLGTKFDAIISAHNIEHCNDPEAVLFAMGAVLKPGGMIFLSFPSEESIHFPSRKGTLNFFDDPTHQTVPNFNQIKSTLVQNGFIIQKAIKRNPGRLYLPRILGWIIEPISRRLNKVIFANSINLTWYFWGFESIIWAKKAD